MLPYGRLPLNLFEERYLAMALDALGEERIIGMVQPLEFQPDPVAGDAPIFGIGCAGRMTSFTETDDRRILISLKGICRFNIAGEVEGRNGYRRVAADYGPFRDDLAEKPGFDFDRDELFGLLRRFFESRGLQTDWDSLENADDETLIVSLAMMCPFGVSEKQALLEAPKMPDVPDCADVPPRHVRRRGRSPRIQALTGRRVMTATQVDPKLLEILVCPLTKGPLSYDAEAQELISEQAGLAYPIRDGIPIMLVDEARKIDGSD